MAFLSFTVRPINQAQRRRDGWNQMLCSWRYREIDRSAENPVVFTFDAGGPVSGDFAAAHKAGKIDKITLLTRRNGVQTCLFGPVADDMGMSKLPHDPSSSPTFRTTLPNAREYPRFAGVPTFCRFPLLDAVPSDQQPVDWALYGIPFDGGVTYRPGARFGPRAIRDASQYIKPVHLEHGLNIAQQFSLADAGDSPVKPYSCKDTLDAACAFAKRIGEPSHTKLLSVGGDHSTAYANIRATWERRGKPKGGLAIIHFDAHLDTAGEIWGETWTHASPFKHAVEEGLIDPKRMISIGIRGPLNTADDLQYAHEHGIQIVTYEDCTTDAGIARIEDFIERLGAEETYLTFDIDCIDPAYAPGTGTPCCGGFSTAEAFDLLRIFAGVNLVGADVVEVLPDRDPAGITALAASHVIFEILALAALNGDQG